MQLHQLKRTHSNKTKKRVGRGGTRGKTSGRGHKGQKARAGGTPRPHIRDIIKKIPKLRGHGKNRARTVNSSRTKPEVVNLTDLNNNFDTDDIVSRETLVEKGLVRVRNKRSAGIKVLSQGEISKKLKYIGLSYSDSAREKIEKSGGTIE